MSDFRIVAAGDAAWLVEWPARIDPALSARAVALARQARRLHGAVRDAVVGYCSVTVYFDPVQIDGGDLEEALRRLALELTGATSFGSTARLGSSLHPGFEAFLCLYLLRALSSAETSIEGKKNPRGKDALRC